MRRRIEPQDPIGQGIASSEVVKEPAVDLARLAKRLLNVVNPLMRH
jgi:hypothetical protein